MFALRKDPGRDSLTTCVSCGREWTSEAIFNGHTFYFCINCLPESAKRKITDVVKLVLSVTMTYQVFSGKRR